LTKRGEEKRTRMAMTPLIMMIAIAVMMMMMTVIQFSSLFIYMLSSAASG
jgi:hypothetical protein